MPRQLLATRFVEVPSDVKLVLDGRKVTVTGKRGTLTRDFRHLTLDMRRVNKEQLRVDLWFGNRKQLACMRFVYAHFPINVTFENNVVEIRNFLGEKRVRRVALSEGVEYVRTNEVKDQIELSGIDLQKVSQDAANISQACLVRRKDIRKFLDGIYVSEKSNIEIEED
ncbi:hypothetical protein BBO99_00000835 [Phytophthora kernoviae]|uniref:Large ribosomal subunit protein uL6 alpha-beta domain-containing protein n=2 Tax=Phytophthora kernoviae TaxID=325452 RepID=A0A3R7I1F7_9STRA|nr:hypothetical protein G195_001572 [Phytophthora kernoviae 00238/432]KAG2531837.1 hypothetical protein JM16_000660 [Phytophthora kernoviae]KAG2532711.1 hypothetical protein JM18_000742 [Phytophthora kernoviae]RLN44407.1 hypothetical protein BBI17_000985 [Phytophthora kernoviae]RLN85072.1 hypothetical protein BBO99_00000835 [Phytophthora kernoviae]